MTASPFAAPAPLPAPGFAVARAAASFARPRAMRSALAGVALTHAALLGVLFFAPHAVEPVAPARPLTVRLVVPEPVTPAPQPVPRPTPPERPPEPRPQRPEPRVDVPEPKREAPSPLLAAKPAPTPLAAPVIETPAPRAEPLPPVAPPSPPPPAPVIEATPAAAPTPPLAADYLSNPKPPYPRLSRRLGEEGTVRLNILVNPDGSVARLELAQSSGHPRLDRSAMETVQSSWKFEPARQGGSPVAAWVIVPIQFTLRS